MSDGPGGPATRLEEAQKQATLALGKVDDRIVEEDTKAAVRLIEAALNRLDRERDGQGHPLRADGEEGGPYPDKGGERTQAVTYEVCQVCGGGFERYAEAARGECDDCHNMEGDDAE